jgi:hypothetical protein
MVDADTEFSLPDNIANAQQCIDECLSLLWWDGLIFAGSFCAGDSRGETR